MRVKYQLLVLIMFKSLFPQKISVLTLTALASLLPFNSAKAITFQETEVPQEEFIAVAQPFGENKYNLIVIEQIPNKNKCWNEVGANPVNVDLLLANFDFSGHCRRSTDANGYSIRYDNQDYGLDYILSLVERDGNLVLIGVNRRDPRQPPVTIGSAQGLNGSPMKIVLNPGWRFTKRTYEGKVLGHVYFSFDSASAPQDTVPNTVEGNINPSNSTNNETLPTTTQSISEEEILQQGTVQEIVAPGVEPRKEWDKVEQLPKKVENHSIDTSNIDDHKPPSRRHNRYNLGQTRFQRMNNN